MLFLRLAFVVPLKNRETSSIFEAVEEVMEFIDTLPKIISNYNSSYHSEIKKAPNEVAGRSRSDGYLEQKVRQSKTRADNVFKNSTQDQIKITTTHHKKSTLIY